MSLPKVQGLVPGVEVEGAHPPQNPSVLLCCLRALRARQLSGGEQVGCPGWQWLLPVGCAGCLTPNSLSPVLLCLMLRRGPGGREEPFPSLQRETGWLRRKDNPTCPEGDWSLERVWFYMARVFGVACRAYSTHMALMEGDWECGSELWSKYCWKSESSCQVLLVTA